MSKIDQDVNSRKFNTFGGVFTPNILTILGIILFLRFGWIVGNAGLWKALVMVFLGSLITLLTALSLSAVSTNIQVKTGGAYYLVSRSLGIEIGGSIGIPLYFSQAISVAFYLIGFAEAFSGTFPQIAPVRTASAVCLIFAVIAYIGASFAINVQYFILIILGLSLFSFFSGGAGLSVPVHFYSDYTNGHHFWSVFAIFFPAVTGIMSGVSMSGDLRDPHKSIPRGTIFAVVCSYIVYSVAIYWFASSAMVGELQTEKFVMKKISRWPVLFTAGVWAATLSSALASMVGAPRTLQALSYDHVTPKFFARKMGSPNEPRIAIITTFVIAETVILLGNLDMVAPVITMFFLNTYGILNLAAGLEKLVGSPSYRPKLNIHWSFSLVGALGCYAIMFLIHTPATLGAIFVSYAIFFTLQNRALRQTWGDARIGIWFSIAQFALSKIEELPLHPKNWKPHIMVFCGNPERRSHLARLAGWLSKGKGITCLFHLIVGQADNGMVKQACKTAKNHLKRFIKENDMNAFAEAQIVEDFEKGVSTIIQSYGIGMIKPNIALFGVGKALEEQERVARIVRNILAFDTSVMMLEMDEEKGFGSCRTIDVWWGGLGGNGDLMLLLAHLISQHEAWSDARVRVLRIVDNPEGIPPAEENIQKLLDDMRISAEAVVVTRNYPEQPIHELLSKHSGETDLTILGIGPVVEGQELDFAKKIESFVEPLLTVLLVRSSGRGDLLATS